MSRSVIRLLTVGTVAAAAIGLTALSTSRKPPRSSIANVGAGCMISVNPSLPQ